jgi:DNA-binding beta-propeller fold protein YncE
MMKGRTFSLPLSMALAVLVCGSAVAAEQADAEPRRAIIRPTLVRLRPGGKQKFKFIMLPTLLGDASKPGRVNWSVNGLRGGSDELGTIDVDGVYHAPARAPSPPEIHICAEAPEAANRFLFATVLMGEPRYELLRSWSGPKESPGHLEDPHGIALDSKGNVIIADEAKSQVMRFTSEGKFLQYIGSGEGAMRGYFTKPRIVQTDASGNIWVSDVKKKGPCLQAFTPEGKLIRVFAQSGTGPGELLRAHGMGFDSRRRLFVTDVDNVRVNVYSHAGEFLYSWGQRGTRTGQFNAPHGLVVDPSDDVFISNFYGPTQKFDAEGNFLFEFAHGDPFDGPVHFHSAAGDQWGDIYLIVRRQGYEADEAKKVKIVKYNNNGDFITAWRFAEPEDRGNCAAVDNDGNIYCVFEHDRQTGVQVFAPR